MTINYVDDMYNKYKLIVNLGVNNLFEECNMLTKTYHKFIFYNIVLNKDKLILAPFKNIMDNIDNNLLDINGYYETYKELKKWNIFYNEYVVKLIKHLTIYKDELSKYYSIQNIVNDFISINKDAYRLLEQTNDNYYGKLRHYIKYFIKDFNKNINVFKHENTLNYDINIINKLGYLCKKLLFSNYLFKDIPIKERLNYDRDKHYCYCYTTMIKIMASHNIPLYDYLSKELNNKEINEDNLLRKILGNKYLLYNIV